MAQERQLYYLREWILRDLSGRNYAGMVDNTAVATDMVVTERIARGARTRWDVLAQTDWGELSKQFDGDAAAQGANPESRRSRALAYMAFLTSDAGLEMPSTHYDTVKNVVQLLFGAGANTTADVTTLLNADDMSRAEWLGWWGETVPRFEERITKAMALPPPTPEQQARIDAWIEARLRGTGVGAQSAQGGQQGGGRRR